MDEQQLQQLLQSIYGNQNFNNSISTTGLPVAPGNVSGFLNSLNTLGTQNTSVIGGLTEQAQGLENVLPSIQNSVNQEILPTAQANLGAAAATSPEYNQLMTDLYAQYGPLLNQIGSQISGQNMAGQVQNEANALNGPGQNLLQSGYNASQIFDAPYYQARQQTANSLGTLLNSIDVSGNLSGSETNAIGQGLAQEDAQRGTLNSPSQANVVSNAMQYGNAAFQRKATEQGILSNAIGTASSFLPQAKSGVNVFGTATGTNAGANPGAGLFTGINSNFGNNLGSQTLSQAGQLGGIDLGGQFGIDTTQLNIAANKKDWADYLSQVSGAIGLGGGGGGSGGGGGGMLMGLLCWVAREVYGPEDSRWIQFREWLRTQAPKELYELYVKEGEFTASLVKENPLLKYILKDWMDSKIIN